MLFAGDTTFLDYASRGGVIALLVIILYGGFKNNPWWVFGWVYRDLLRRHSTLRDEKNAWQTTALRGTHIAESVVDLTASDSSHKLEKLSPSDTQTAH